MREKEVDLRQCERIFFTETDKVSGIAIVEEMAGQTVPVKFLNLSAGGIGFQVERDICQKISRNQVIKLKIARTELLAFLDNIKLEVKYVLDYDIVPQVTFGCQFIDLSQVALNAIRKMVAGKLELMEK
jgi:hypothetical protein